MNWHVNGMNNVCDESGHVMAAICISPTTTVEDIITRSLLMAASPDLLAAAKQALEECCDLCGTDAGNALNAAIHKAEGTAECDLCGTIVPVERSLCSGCYADQERGAEADSDATLGTRA